ncbi:hypothetical protein ACIBH1_05425 [Nonomuraea sp. NPDC050663]|uniref:hypothetical protein n=1 Tax=Nonomuraea sp. NPDC050663 TaxID=3364370 RepID=UPI0037B28463
MAQLRSTPTSSQSTNPTYPVNKPGGTAAGDILIAFQTSAAFGNAAMTAPTGGTTWQPLGQRSDTEWAGTKVWWKVAGPTEPASYTFKQSSGPGGIAAIAAIWDHDGVTPQLLSAENADSDSTVTCPGLTPEAAPGVSLRWAAGLGAGLAWQPPTGHVEQVDRTVGEATAALAARVRTDTSPVAAATFTATGLPIFSHGFTVDVGGISGTPTEPPPAIPPSADVRLKSVFVDLLTDDYITTLDLFNVNFDRLINDAAPFSASVEVNSRELADKVAKVVPRWISHPSEPDSLSTGPGRTVCHVYINGVIWKSAIIWTANVAQRDRGVITVELQGASLESYLNAVEIRDDYSYADVDQLEIGRQLIVTEMQALSGADIGLTAGSETSGVTRDRTYLASEGGTFGQRLAELADTDGGFEWMIQTSDPGTGARTRELKLGYPKLGSTTDHVFSYPGNVIAWSMSVDALRAATSYRARGESVSFDASTRAEPLMSTPQDATAHLAAGWPRVDKTLDYSTVKEQSTLNAYAARWAAERPGTVRVHQITVRLDETKWTPNNLGDYARIILSNDWWPIVGGGASFNFRWRIIGAKVRAASRSGPATITFALEEEVEI